MTIWKFEINLSVPDVVRDSENLGRIPLNVDVLFFNRDYEGRRFVDY
jgi:hypothetical protein